MKDALTVPSYRGKDPSHSGGAGSRTGDPFGTRNSFIMKDSDTPLTLH